MPALPRVPFGPIEITRLVSGGNPLCGNSHFSDEMSREMREHFTAERVVEYLRRCEQAGINTLQARGDYHRVLHWLELFRRQGGRLHWIAQTASEMHDVFQNIRVLAAAGAASAANSATAETGTAPPRAGTATALSVVRRAILCLSDGPTSPSARIPPVRQTLTAWACSAQYRGPSLSTCRPCPREALPSVQAWCTVWAAGRPAAAWPCSVR